MEEETKATPDIVIINGDRYEIVDIKTCPVDGNVLNIQVEKCKGIIVLGVGICANIGEQLALHMKNLQEDISAHSIEKRIMELAEEESIKFKQFYDFDPLFLEEVRINKRDMNNRARHKQWTGKQFKQKNNRRTNRIAYNHGKHRKK